MKKSNNSSKLKTIRIQNRRAGFEYTLLDRYTSGLVLRGTEVKSIRAGKANLQESFCYFRHDELWIKGMNVAHYDHGNLQNHEETRSRKLLLKRKELNKLLKNKLKGMTIVPTELFVNNKGLIKLNIALAKGKKMYDKRQSIKDRDEERKLRKI